MSRRTPVPDVELATDDVTIKTSEGSMSTHLVFPTDCEPQPLVIFLMDAPGKRPLLHQMAAVIASHGYFVALPNLYYREVPSFELDFDSQESRAEMTRLTRTVGNRMVVRDVGALFEFARSHPAARVGDVGLVGYCMSGPFALYSAAEYPDSVRAAASFYGVRLHVESVDSPHHRLSEVIGEIYVAAAEHDPYVPMDMVERFETSRAAAGTRGQVEVYWGTHHGFAFDDRPAYDPVADDRHWKELLSLFDRNLHSFRD